MKPHFHPLSASDWLNLDGVAVGDVDDAARPGLGGGGSKEQ